MSENEGKELRSQGQNSVRQPSGGRSLQRQGVPGKSVLTDRLGLRQAAATGSASARNHPVQQSASHRDSREDWSRVAMRPDRYPRPDIPPPVQARGGIDSAGGAVHEHAAQGISGSASPLPHRERIEQSFGPRFDLGHVQAHVGGAAAAASDAIGATAYATGHHVAFRSSPDLHTAAHEAAHVVQQQQGVHLRGGVGRAGDEHERHADAVADLVVQGKSAETLLAQRAPAAPAAGVQGKDAGAAVIQANGGVLDWMADRVGDWTDSRPDEERRDAEEELETFMGQPYEVEHFHPSAGRGNFDAAYQPGSGILTITVSVFFVFRDGSPGNPDWVANTAAGDPTFPADAFVWTEDEKTEFARNAVSMVQQHWSRQYTFHCTRPYWEALPDVNVDIAITDAPDAATAHYNIEVFKWPDDRVDAAHIDRPGANHGAAHAGHQHNSGTDPDHVGGVFNENSLDGGVGTPDVSDFRRTTATRNAYGQADVDNPSPILFDEASSTISAADQTRIRTFTATMSAPAMPDFALTVIGHASSDGSPESNQILSEDRAHAVSNELVTGGVKSQPTVRGVGATGATTEPLWRRVDLTVGDFRSQQTTVLHEFGHVFGLADEYPTADGGSRDVGTPVDHSQLAQNMGLAAAPVVAHHSDSIMSNGEVVEPYHYATFLEVLGTMTSTTGMWSAGPGPGPAPGPGDFPTPTGDTRLA